MTATPGALPSSSLRPPHGERSALAGVTARWQASEALPTAVASGLVDRIRHRVAADGGETASVAAWPPGWPDADHGLPALVALAHLEEDVLAALLADGALQPGALAAVRSEFTAARSRIAMRAVERHTAPGLTVAQALAARDRQLSIATHELRTPISSILLNLQMLERVARERGTVDAETIGRMLAVPGRQLRRLTHMVDRLLEVAQVETDRLSLRPEALDLCEVVHEAAARLGELARASHCEISLEGCEPVQGRWDRLRIEQVVTNLLTNAIKYGGGRVEVITRREAMACFEVHDHGGGIAAEDQERIFLPFERLPSSRSEDGAGLGLYIVREIVRAHGGRITVQSTPGQGSTFTVSLPL